MIELDRLLKNIIIHPEQGYALYLYDGGNELTKVKGKRNICLDDEITLNSNFRLASVTKQFIAFGIVHLIKKGLLSYDTSIKSIFSELPDYFNNINVKNLLNHTSGIYNYESMEHSDNDPQLQDDDIIEFLKKTDGTYFEIGSTYKYSNTAYILLGLIIKKIANCSIGEFFDKEVFHKAGMIHSVVNYEGVTNVFERAYGHVITEKTLIMKDQYWCSATIGDGGLYSSVNDLKKWVKFLVTSEEYKDMKVPNYINSSSYNEYGLGIRIIDVNGKKIVYHCGETIGTNTLVLFSEDYNICLILLTNVDGVDTSIMKDNLIDYLING